MNSPRRPPFFWLVVLACALYVGFFVFCVSLTIRVYAIAKTPGWTLRGGRGGWIVSSVDADGPAAGRIQPGDRLLAIDGDQRSAVIGVS